MYWLYGAPSIFAANLHDLAPQHATYYSPDQHRSHDQSQTDDLVSEIDSERNATDVIDRAEDPALDYAQENNDEDADRRHLLARETNAGRGEAKDAKLSVEFTFVEAQHGGQQISERVLKLRPSRSAHLFITLGLTNLTVWQTKPTVAVTSIVRSLSSIEAYGINVDVHVRSDFGVIAVQTTKDFIITYTLVTKPDGRIYHQLFPDSASGHARHRSFSGRSKGRGLDDADVAGPGEGDGVKEVEICFNGVSKVKNGIAALLAVDSELLVATKGPATIQPMRWIDEKESKQSNPIPLSELSWLNYGASISDMVYDRPMNIMCWITNDGMAYAVQRNRQRVPDAPDEIRYGFKGFRFHTPENSASEARKAAINARFSLLALGCHNGDIFVYTARDYQGHIPLSTRIPAPHTASGALNFLAYSPDGYCLFAGYENGWATWSVYGAPGASSFAASGDRSIASANDEDWLLNAHNGFWIGGGAQFLLLSRASADPDSDATSRQDDKLWVLNAARSAVAGCYCSANLARSLLQTSNGFMIYRGYDISDLSALSAEKGLWHSVQIPPNYLAHHWPVRSAVMSPDGRYVAIAGRRGLAHYSVNSGRWKTFEDPAIEHSFTVRGGMCWYQHVLIAAVETSNSHEVRVYSREAALDHDHIMHIEELTSPIVLISPSGEDSLLVYTYENQLYHYIIASTANAVSLVQVGQITLNGIIRAPPRVRAISWILPEEQLENGDPAQDVATATIIFLVDGKLVLLHPAMKEGGELKYEMRIIAHDVEYHVLARDQQYFQLPDPKYASSTGHGTVDISQNDLRDSLWTFNGKQMNVWPDVQDILSFASLDATKEVPAPVSIPVDFYPLSVLLSKGLLFGAESDMTQRRDISFSSLRFITRTHLFIPPILRHHLSTYNSPSALYLSHQYQSLPYLPHALEVLLHDVLDDEVDSPPQTPETAVLPTVLSFLESSQQFLDIIVNCTRKTELRSWRTLFRYLPPPKQLFEQALSRGQLKTAGGYLLVMHTLEEEEEESHEDEQTNQRITSSTSASSSTVIDPKASNNQEKAEKEREDQVVRLLSAASEKGDWGLCKELARFLMALDGTGSMLRQAMKRVGFLDSEADDHAKSSGGLAIRSRSNGSGIAASGGRVAEEEKQKRDSYF